MACSGSVGRDGRCANVVSVTDGDCQVLGVDHPEVKDEGAKRCFRASG